MKISEVIEALHTLYHPDSEIQGIIVTNISGKQAIAVTTKNSEGKPGKANFHVVDKHGARTLKETKPQYLKGQQS